MSANTLYRLRKIFRDKLEVGEDVEIVPSDCLTNLDINSISFLKLVVEIEKEFGIEFDDEVIDMNKFGTIQSLLGYIDGNITTKI